MVSKASEDFPEPESPVMQTSLFRGRRTVTSLRLCSRAPWTTSSSEAITDPVYRGGSDRTSVRSAFRKPAPGAAPGPVRGSCAEARTNRVQQDVVACALEVVLAFDHTRAIATGEKVAVPGVALVEALRIDAVEPLHARGEVGNGAAKDHVVVRSHQTDRVELPRAPLRGVHEHGQKEPPVAVVPEEPRAEHRAAIRVEVAVREHRSRRPRHVCDVRAGRPGATVSARLLARVRHTPAHKGQTLPFGACRVATSPDWLRAEAFDQSVDLARPRDVFDLEVARHDRAIAEQPPDQPLLDLDRTDPREAHRSSAFAQRAVDDEELVRGEDDARLLPVPHRAQRYSSGKRLQRNTQDRGRPADRHQSDSDRRHAERSSEGQGEHDRVPALVEADAFPA